MHLKQTVLAYVPLVLYMKSFVKIVLFVLCQCTNHLRYIKANKQHFKLCRSPCLCFIAGGIAHNLGDVCSGAEYAQSALEGAAVLPPAMRA